MPVNKLPHRALPARFRRNRWLIVGCGDVGVRIAQQVLRSSGASYPTRARVFALTSSPEKIPELQALGITPLLGNLDQRHSLKRLKSIAHRIVHMAPPPSLGHTDTRSKNLMYVLRQGCPPQALVYGSTTGVYGDCGGEWVDETRALHPQTDRAWRRVDAEQQWLSWGRRSALRIQILRIPGIYALDRTKGTPQVRLSKGLPVLCTQDDVFTNHIHADDLAAIAIAALWRGKPQRIYHACDDTQLRMGDYFDLAADLLDMPRPPRLSFEAAQQILPSSMLSFMHESRRLKNTRIKQELRFRFRYPTVREGLSSRFFCSHTC